MSHCVLHEMRLCSRVAAKLFYLTSNCLLVPCTRSLRASHPYSRHPRFCIFFLCIVPLLGSLLLLRQYSFFCLLTVPLAVLLPKIVWRCTISSHTSPKKSVSSGDSTSSWRKYPFCSPRWLVGAISRWHHLSWPACLRTREFHTLRPHHRLGKGSDQPPAAQAPSLLSESCKTGFGNTVASTGRGNQGNTSAPLTK